MLYVDDSCTRPPLPPRLCLLPTYTTFHDTPPTSGHPTSTTSPHRTTSPMTLHTDACVKLQYCILHGKVGKISHVKVP